MNSGLEIKEIQDSETHVNLNKDLAGSSERILKKGS